MNTFSEDIFGATLTVSLNEAEQFNFDLITVQGPKRNYVILRPGWADKLFTIIVRETQSECCFQFKRVDVIETEFKTNAICAECNGLLSVFSILNRTKLKVQIHLGNKPHTYAKRRRLAKEKAFKLVEELKSDTVHNVHMNMVDELDESIERLPRDFPLHKTLENLKYRSQAHQDSAIIELRKMKYLPQYSSALKEICTDPFRIVFWTKEQIFTFFQIRKRERVCLSFDATGGLINRHSLLLDIKPYFDSLPELPHIFLYLLCIKCSGNISIPVGQMLSALQDSVTIKYFLDLWAKEFAIPDEVTVDDSAALQKSIVLSFTRFTSVIEYLNACFLVLNNEDIKRPECYLRLDIPHYIKSWQKDSVFEKVDKRVKHYYLCVMGVITQCESYADIKNIVKNALILANYPYIGNFNDTELPSGDAIKNLNAVIQTHDTSFLGKETDEAVNEFDNVRMNEISTTNIYWFDDMLKNIKTHVLAQGFSKKTQQTASNQTNWFFLPQINEFLQYHISRLPLWSAVMRKYFDSNHQTGISTDIESRFQVLKNNVFKNINLPVRADVFFKKYIKDASAMARLNRMLSMDINNNVIDIDESIQIANQAADISGKADVSAIDHHTVHSANVIESASKKRRTLVTDQVFIFSFFLIRDSFIKFIALNTG